MPELGKIFHTFYIKILRTMHKNPGIFDILIMELYIVKGY
jgi:hypothetical protein